MSRHLRIPKVPGAWIHGRRQTAFTKVAARELLRQIVEADHSVIAGHKKGRSGRWSRAGPTRDRQGDGVDRVVGDRPGYCSANDLEPKPLPLVCRPSSGGVG